MGLKKILPEKAAFTDRRKIRIRLLRLTHLPDKNESPENLVHDLRVIGKRLRAFLKLFGTAIGKTRCRFWKQKIRQATKPLASARSSQVLQKMLANSGNKKLLPSTPRPDPLSKPTLNALSPEIQKAFFILRKTRTFLVQHALPLFLAKDVRHQLKRSGKKVLQHQKKSRSATSGPLLHDLRKSIKQLLYQMELASPKGNRNRGKPMGFLKNAGDLLGRIHDGDELRKALRGLPQTEKLLQKIRDQQKKQAHRVFKIAAKF